MSPRLIKIAAAATVVAALALGGAAWAVAAAGDDDGPSATGPGADRAKAAALAHTGGGTANEVEANDEEGAWEVEVTKPNGQTVDVHLDAGFDVLSVEGDSENEDAGGDD
jgi:Peptidase propeptide and YPEB domain